MNVANFAEELTNLVIKWTSPMPEWKSPNNETPVDFVPLTKHQVLGTAQDVFRAVLQIDSVFGSDDSSVKTPANNGITVTTPAAPVVSKANHNQNGGTLSRSLDTLVANNTDSKPDLLSTKSQEEMEVEKGSNENKISRSTPTIPVLKRFDTFIQEDENTDAKDTETSDEVFVKSDPTLFNDTVKPSNLSFLQKLDILRKSAVDVISKIDDVTKHPFSQSTKPIRRLSSVASFPELTRSSTTMRAIPPPKIRRSFTTFPGTPTSSRLNSTVALEKGNSTKQRKTTRAASVTEAQNAKLKVSPGINRSTSNLSLQSDKKSPGSNRSSSTLCLQSEKKSPGIRPAKNPKYAHVQSTIPKAVVGKRKAQ